MFKKFIVLILFLGVCLGTNTSLGAKLENSEGKKLKHWITADHSKHKIYNRILKSLSRL